MTMSFNVSVSNCENLGNLPLFEGFDVVPIRGVSHGIERPYAYLFKRSDLIVIVFTGTMFFDQWEDDLEMSQVSLSNTPIDTSKFGDMKVHRGYLDIYLSLRDNLRKNVPIDSQVIITGHSMGGALAALCTLDLLDITPITYTFASPRLFNTTFKNSIFRVFNTEDVIPMLPLPITGNDRFVHVGIDVPFTINLGSNALNHTVAYLEYLP
jgi:triacylglycerol lipase